MLNEICAISILGSSLNSREPLSDNIHTQSIATAILLAGIFHMTFFNTFSWMKMLKFRFKFHSNLLLGVQLIISQHWFRHWLDDEHATSHYLNQCWPSSLTHICVTRGIWDKQLTVRLSWMYHTSKMRILVAMYFHYSGPIQRVICF